jgi:Raf kinase inhibitor-like YbhB/YbcL family protein
MNFQIIGRLLRGVRAGDDKLACNHPALQSAPATIDLRSDTFATGGMIPPRCAGTGVGDNISPQLAWQGVPPASAELVLIMQDPDAPLPRPVAHLIAYGIDPKRASFAEGALSPGATGVRLGQGTFGKPGYQGPRPVPGHGPHRYIFQVIATTPALNFDVPPRLDAVLAALRGNVLAWGQLVGRYER